MIGVVDLVLDFFPQRLKTLFGEGEDFIVVHVEDPEEVIHGVQLVGQLPEEVFVARLDLRGALKREDVGDCRHVLLRLCSGIFLPFQGQSFVDAVLRRIREAGKHIGQPRTIKVPDRKIAGLVERHPKAEDGNPDHVAAPMPGVIGTIAVNPGQSVEIGDMLLSIEAMKMETAIRAAHAGKIKSISVKAGMSVDAKDLLLEYAGA